MLLEHLLEREAAFLGVRGGRRALDLVEPAPSVVLDEVGDQRDRTRAVVRGHHVGRPLARAARDDHDGQPPGQALDERRWDDALAEEQPVDLAGQRQQPGQVRSGVLDVGDQHRLVLGADERLDAAQNLVVEQQRHALHVVLHLCPGLHADQADHVLAPAGQALRGTVRDVSQLLDDLEHARAGGVPDQVLAVHDPGNGGDGDLGQAGDVIQRHRAAGVAAFAGAVVGLGRRLLRLHAATPQPRGPALRVIAVPYPAGGVKHLHRSKRLHLRI